jgi:hypothetical protein
VGKWRGDWRERERLCTLGGGQKHVLAVLARPSSRGPRERVRRWAVRKVKRWEVDISAYGQRVSTAYVDSNVGKGALDGSRNEAEYPHNIQKRTSYATLRFNNNGQPVINIVQENYRCSYCAKYQLCKQARARQPLLGNSSVDRFPRQRENTQ